MNLKLTFLYVCSVFKDSRILVQIVLQSENAELPHILIPSLPI